MNLKDKEGCMGGFVKKKEKGEMVYSQKKLATSDLRTLAFKQFL